MSPYAAKAVIQHQWNIDHLDIFITFQHPMQRYTIPLTDPPVYDHYPPVTDWTLLVDDVEIDVVASAWQDLYTLKLTSDTVASPPAEVTLAYTGTSDLLETTWHKNWESWGAITSIDLTQVNFTSGMILLWYIPAGDVPPGWYICDGNAGTPDLTADSPDPSVEYIQKL